MTCVFWKEGASEHYWGLWSPEGCRTEKPSPSQVLCRCNHLSYFAVLMVCVHPVLVRGVKAIKGPVSKQKEQAKAGVGDRKSNSDGLKEAKRNL